MLSDPFDLRKWYHELGVLGIEIHHRLRLLCVGILRWLRWRIVGTWERRLFMNCSFGGNSSGSFFSTGATLDSIAAATNLLESTVQHTHSAITGIRVLMTSYPSQDVHFCTSHVVT